MTIDDALQNWARWARDRAIQGHCASIEYRFRFRTTPDVDWREAPPVVPLPPIDALEALEVERVMRHLPEGHRRALVLFYVVRIPYKGCCRLLHLGYDMWGKYLSDAQCMVAALFTRHNGSDIRQTTIRQPAHAEYIGA